jgi:hypothetical protein
MARMPRLIKMVVLVTLLGCAGCASWRAQHPGSTDVGSTSSSGSFLQDQVQMLANASANDWNFKRVGIWW